MPERRILPQQWTFLNTNSDFLRGVRNGRNKSGFSIHTEILQILRDVLNDIRSEAFHQGYIENILLDHLKTYQDLLNHTASQRRRDKTIDL